MERVLKRLINKKQYLNEVYIEVLKKDFKDTCMYIYRSGEAILRTMFAADEREIDGTFKIYSVFSVPGNDEFSIIYTSLSDEDLSFPSLTMSIPAAHWYEREIHDMFGLVPEGHPDLRRLVFHESFPTGSHPLRRDWAAKEADLKEWGEGITVKHPYHFMEVAGEGITEIPVGPVHAGIIEPGHFRFSAVGETVFFLEPRLFYTHKGTEKHFETLGFFEGVRLAERVSGTSSFSHSAAYCMAVERMAGIVITEKAKAVRTLFLELERLYNHIGDIGNMCAGSGLAVGYAKGAVIKERLMQLNEKLTGSRYLRGINSIGGVNRDAFLKKDDIMTVLGPVTKEYKSLMKLLIGSVSHMDRMETTGRLSKEIAVRLGATGVAARASGINDDIRIAHPHLLYDRLHLEPNTASNGDVFARMMVRAEETECSLSMIETLFENSYGGALLADKKDIPPLSSALGYTETPRGSVFYWVKSDRKGNTLRVKLRSPSYCNWPAVPSCVPGNIVPDFPIINKSFNLSYSGCDM